MALVIPLLLAQLVAPPLQPGPVRLPGEGSRPTLPLTPQAPPGLAPTPAAPTAPAPAPTPAPYAPAAPTSAVPAPAVRGFNPYSPEVLARLLATCAAGEDPAQRLDPCAAALQARLFADGYINSRVIAQPEPPPGALEVVPGKIEAIEVVSASRPLQRRLERLLQPLRGSVLRLPTLSATLTRIQRLRGVGLLKANLNRIAEDSSRALLVVTAEPASQPLRGEVALRNDGNAGSGQFRGLATLVKDNAIFPGDILLLFGEVNADSDPEVGSRIGSLSYVLPLHERLSLTTALGASRRTLVEQPPPLHDLSYRQLQLYSQLDLTLHESLRGRWTAFTGLSVNRTDAFLAGASFPAIPGGGDSGWLRTGFARFGIGYDQAAGPLALNASLYGLQGLGALSTPAQRQELRFLGIVPDQATALGSELSLSWQLAPRWLLDLRGAGQVAFQPLTNAMGFSLGSDNGLRGLPGQAVSGDSGLLGSMELAFLLWRGRNDAVQLVPFIGAGGVWTSVPGATLHDSVGAGGVLLRWSRGAHGVLELGWVRQEGSDPQNFWQSWMLGSGFYSKLLLRF